MSDDEDEMSKLKSCVYLFFHLHCREECSSRVEGVDVDRGSSSYYSTTPTSSSSMLENYS